MVNRLRMNISLACALLLSFGCANAPGTVGALPSAVVPPEGTIPGAAVDEAPLAAACEPLEIPDPFMVTVATDDIPLYLEPVAVKQIARLIPGAETICLRTDSSGCWVRVLQTDRLMGWVAAGAIRGLPRRAMPPLDDLIHPGNARCFFFGGKGFVGATLGSFLYSQFTSPLTIQGIVAPSVRHVDLSRDGRAVASCVPSGGRLREFAFTFLFGDPRIREGSNRFTLEFVEEDGTVACQYYLTYADPRGLRVFRPGEGGFSMTPPGEVGPGAGWRLVDFALFPEDPYPLDEYTAIPQLDFHSRTVPLPGGFSLTFKLIPDASAADITGCPATVTLADARGAGHALRCGALSLISTAGSRQGLYYDARGNMILATPAGFEGTPVYLVYSAKLGVTRGLYEVASAAGLKDYPLRLGFDGARIIVEQFETPYDRPTAPPRRFELLIDTLGAKLLP